MTNYKQIRVSDPGIEKVKGVKCNDEEVRKVADVARQAVVET